MISDIFHWNLFLSEKVNCFLYIFKCVDSHFSTRIWNFLNYWIRIVWSILYGIGVDLQDVRRIEHEEVESDFFRREDLDKDLLF